MGSCVKLHYSLIMATFAAQLPGFLVGLIFTLLGWAWDLLVNAFYSIVPPPKKSIEDDVILVTGAASGIGRLTAYKLADRKPRMIVVWDMNEAENEKTRACIEKKGVKALAFKIDLSSRERVRDVAEATKKAVRAALDDKTAYVSMLINNAGIVTGKKMLQCPDRLMQLTMDVNATCHFWTLKEFFPDMLPFNKGHVVTIASGAGLGATAGLLDSCASKFAAVGLTESLYMEIDKLQRSVNVTLVCPYLISTGMFEGVKNKYDWLMPIIEPDDMAERIVTGILNNEYMVLYPRIMYGLLLAKNFLPITSYLRLTKFLGVNN